MENNSVRVWEETVVIPTYGTGMPDKNPMFFENRIYQGSSGVVYPNPVIEKINAQKEDKTYAGLFLENKYLKIMILPELGGRVQMAYDKIKQRHFIYYNQVIKPALVGLTGPWISGGIEFNWPQHHRPSTFDPIDYEIRENADGSKTVLVNEIEKMFHTKAMTAFTLYPDVAYLEIKAKLYNRSVLPQTFLWWANPAVKVNDDYQSVFPPDVNAVFDHGKRDVSSFPIATGTYYKVDYSPGTDISRYKNIPVPTSYMAINSKYDFVGGYEHDTRAGLLHVANHHVSPGKKQWTWGHGDFGKAWDRNLTDEDGPYIELMTGVFTDNQPDFTWLMPAEQKSFTQYFLPYRELGMVKNATKDILVALDYTPEKILVKIFVTSVQQQLKILLTHKGTIIFEETVDIKPEFVFSRELITGPVDENEVILKVLSQTGKTLLCYEAQANKTGALPEPAKAVPEPAAIDQIEELFLAGQHLEQYRHATYSPVPYYEEALKRDSNDIRSNNALGLWYLRRGRFALSEPYFRRAIKTSLQRNPNPYDSECYYNLGVCLSFLDREEEAYTAFYKAAWGNAWKDSAYFAIAQIDMKNSAYDLVLEHVSLSLDKNADNSKAYVLKAAAYRHMGEFKTAISVCEEALRRDSFNLGALYELALTAGLSGEPELAGGYTEKLLALSRGYDENLIAYALDYSAAGLYREAFQLLHYAVGEPVGPMVCYHLGYFLQLSGNTAGALSWFHQAGSADPYLCFPNRLEEIKCLQAALSLNPGDARANYYLGNLFYDKRQYDEAIIYWENAAQLDSSFPTVFRNLGIAYYNKRFEVEKALAAFERAFELDPADARVMMELDQLYKKLNRQPAERLDFIEKNLETTMLRDDLYLERLTIYNFLGENKKALNLIMDRKFHPWEGGEGKVSGQYVQSLIALARQDIHEGDFKAAMEKLCRAQYYPDHLGEGKLSGARENDIFFWLSVAYSALGKTDEAMESLLKAAEGTEDLSAAIFYNDQQPDKLFYQGLAGKKLGHLDYAHRIFQKMIDYGRQHQNDKVRIDYFAVSLPNLLIFDDDLDIRNKVHCLFMQGLGYLGLGDKEKAQQLFREVLQYNADHSGARLHLDFAEHADPF
jgi:tetratricopeptide (TPR) repeat protein